MPVNAYIELDPTHDEGAVVDFEVSSRPQLHTGHRRFPHAHSTILEQVCVLYGGPSVLIDLLFERFVT